MECFIRVLPNSARCRLDILLRESGGNIARDQAVLRHLIRLHPHAHRIGAAQHHQLSNTLNTQQLGLDIDVDIVGKEMLIEGVVGRRNGEDLQHTRLPFYRLHAYHFHLRRQLRRSGRNLVLHIHRCHIGVGALLEIDEYLRRTGIGGGRGHIGHVLHAVDGFLQRRNHRLLHTLARRTEVLCHHHHRRRCYIGVLLYRQG